MACSRELAARWCALAERRLDHLTELFDSGRWRRYYTEQSFIEDLRHAKAAVQTWKALAAGEVEPVSIVPSQTPAAMVAAPPPLVHRAQPEPIAARPAVPHSVEHRPIELPRSLETIVANSEIIVEPEPEPQIELAAQDLEPLDFVESGDVPEDDIAPDLADAPLRIDMSALEQALSIGIESDAEYDTEYDEPVVDLDAIERRYPALAVAY
ncbi:TIGR03809 family protein [Bradyrhizobium sp. ORS 375]|uniref:TIGR03809 family protein n=1 Tax=Bradyrhizobium sp. (strain ORS 375) TaxID=566679 RepID=UPI0002E95804|nr:TIGR03809 family protein [Bradyrhizobium sp. ORS 375]